MFYCNRCGALRGWPIGVAARSYGPCEICGEVALCNNVRSSELPMPKAPVERCMHYINHLIVMTREARKDDDDRSPPSRVEVECTACGWKGWYRRER